jgi:flagellar hook-associated protein 3 FlgL
MTTIGRVTHATVRNSTLENLQTNLHKMSNLQAQMSSGSKIAIASDDPAGTADVLQLQGQQRMLTQYARNADDGEAWLTTVDSALSTSLAQIRKARQLTVQGGDGALGDTSRTALAQEIEGIRDALLTQANTTYLGRPVFAGTAAGPAFTGAGAGAASYTWNGVAAGSVDRTVGAGTTIRVDSVGADVFGSGADSVFAVLDGIVATLRAGGDPTDQLDAIDGHMTNMLTEVSSVGARQNQVDSAQTLIAESQLTSKTRLSSIQDVDLAQIILDLGSQEVAYKGALGAAAKVLQPTLMDFLR